MLTCPPSRTRKPFIKLLCFLVPAGLGLSSLFPSLLSSPTRLNPIPGSTSYSLASTSA